MRLKCKWAKRRLIEDRTARNNKLRLGVFINCSNTRKGRQKERLNEKKNVTRVSPLQFIASWHNLKAIWETLLLKFESYIVSGNDHRRLRTSENQLTTGNGTLHKAVTFWLKMKTQNVTIKIEVHIYKILFHEILIVNSRFLI